MRNKDVIENFVEGIRGGRTKTLFVEGNVLYSYGYHFPLAVRGYSKEHGRKFVVNKDKYSSTTSRHQSLLESAIDNHPPTYTHYTTASTIVSMARHNIPIPEPGEGDLSEVVANEVMARLHDEDIDRKRITKDYFGKEI